MGASQQNQLAPKPPGATGGDSLAEDAANDAA